MNFNDEEPSLIPYEIKETEAFLRQANQIDPDSRRLDDALETLQFIIARTPRSFPTLDATPIYYAHYDGDPPVRVCFAFNGQYVTFVMIDRQRDIEEL